MSGEKLTLNGNKLVFKNILNIFTLRGDVLKIITDYKLNTIGLTDAKMILDCLDKFRVYTHT